MHFHVSVNFNSRCDLSVRNCSHLLLTLKFSSYHLFSPANEHNKTNQYIIYFQHFTATYAPICWNVYWRFKFLTVEEISCSEILTSSNTSCVRCTRVNKCYSIHQSDKNSTFQVFCPEDKPS
jgi:hypothetical protein